MKDIARDLTPPAVWRLVKGMLKAPGTANAVIRGRERGPEFYDREFARSTDLKWHYCESRYYPFWTVLADRMLRNNISSVIDLGCGPGQFGALLRDKGIPKYLGVDFSHERISEAKKVCPEFDFACADVFETDLLETWEYDAVVCTEFLEHVRKDMGILRRVRSGTRLFGSVPNFAAWSHVRHFASAREVLNRYGSRLQEFTVDKHLATVEGAKYFLMEGIVR